LKLGYTLRFDHNNIINLLENTLDFVYFIEYLTNIN